MPNIKSDENDLEQLLQSMSYLSGEEVKQLLGNKVFHAALDTSTKKIPRGGYLLITTKDSNAQLNEYPHSLELRLDLELTLKVDPECSVAVMRYSPQQERKFTYHTKEQIKTFLKQI